MWTGVECAQIREALLSKLHDESIGVEALRQLVRARIITPEVQSELVRLLHGNYAELGLSIVETGYITKEILNEVCSVLRRENCSDEAKRRAANIFCQAAKKRIVDKRTQKQYAKLLMDVYDDDTASERTQVSIVDAVKSLSHRDAGMDLEVVAFFLDIINQGRFCGTKIQAAWKLAEMGNAPLVAPYLLLISQEEEDVAYRLEALKALIDIGYNLDMEDCINQAMGALRAMLEHYREYTPYMDRIMNCVDCLDDYDIQSFVPLLLNILENESDPSVTEPVIDVLTRRGIKDGKITNCLRQWLERRTDPRQPTMALIYLARTGEITKRDIKRISAQAIQWESIAREWLRKPRLELPAGIDDTLTGLSCSCQQSPQTLLVRICLGSFDQEDFCWAVETLNTSPDISIRAGLLEVLSEVWLRQCYFWSRRQQGCCSQ